MAPHYYCTECKSSFFEDEVTVPDEADKEAVKEIQDTIRPVSYTHLKEYFIRLQGGR